MEEHVKHLPKVFQRLKENKLYVKFEKCEFGVSKVDFFWRIPNSLKDSNVSPSRKQRNKEESEHVP